MDTNLCPATLRKRYFKVGEGWVKGAGGGGG